MPVDPNDLAADILNEIEDATGNAPIPAAETIWLALATAMAPYFGEGGGAVSSVSAGSSMVAVSPTTGDVVVDVVPANFTGIPQSAVTNLTTDLAGKASSSHTHAESDITSLTSDLAARPTGSGTSGKLSKWTGTTALGDSLLSESGSTVTVTGSAVVSTNLTVSTMTAGSILFAGTSGLVSQSNSKLYWDNTNNRLGIGTNSLSRTMAIVGSDPGTHLWTLQNTSATGYTAFDFVDNAGVSKMGWGYNNNVLTNYLSLNGGANFLIGGAATVGTLFNNGRVNWGSTTTDPGVAFRVEGAAKFNSTLAVDGSATIGDSTGDTHTINGIVTHAGAASSSSQYKLTAGGNGMLSHLAYTADNVALGYDIHYNGSNWVAANSTVALAYKISGHYAIQGSSGNSVGGTPTLNNLFDIDLSNGLVTFAQATQYPNSSAAVSSSNTGRIRYNSSSQLFQVSVNGGAYAAIPQGSGTSGKLTKWTSTTGALGDSIISESGSAATVTGALDVTGTFTSKGTTVLCDGTGDTLKFYGGTGAAQQTVTGSRGGNAALADLLTKLATLGLIVDGTSA